MTEEDCRIHFAVAHTTNSMDPVVLEIYAVCGRCVECGNRPLKKMETSDTPGQVEN